MNKKADKISALLFELFPFNLSLGEILNASVDILNAKNSYAFNFFCLGIREVLRLFYEMANENQIKQCVWYNDYGFDANANNMVTTKQKLYFMLLGGINPLILTNQNETLENIDTLCKINRTLNNHVHLNIKTDKNEWVLKANEIFDELFLFFDNYNKLLILKNNYLESYLDEKIQEYIGENILQEFDEIATHYYSPISFVEKIEVDTINKEYILMNVQGVISADVQYGSDYDVKNGDGHYTNEAFPFVSKLKISIDNDLFNEIETVSIYIDNEKFYE